MKRTLWSCGPRAALVYQIDYVWNLDNTLDSRVESDYTLQPAPRGAISIATREFFGMRR